MQKATPKEQGKVEAPEKEGHTIKPEMAGCGVNGNFGGAMEQSENILIQSNERHMFFCPSMPYGTMVNWSLYIYMYKLQYVNICGYIRARNSTSKTAPPEQ